jgi:DNA-damage-inducible protein J
MAATALVQARVAPELKADVEGILNQIGLDIPTAIRMFFSRIRYDHGLPFAANQPLPIETVEAMDEAVRIAHDPSAKSYTDMADLIAALNSEDD